MKRLLIALALSAGLGQAADIETYKPLEPSGTKTEYTANEDGRNRRLVEVKNFGIDEARPAHDLGLELANSGLRSGEAEAEIWKAAWQKYPNDRFFARCFYSEAIKAYDDAVGAPEFDAATLAKDPNSDLSKLSYDERCKVADEDALQTFRDSPRPSKKAKIDTMKARNVGKAHAFKHYLRGNDADLYAITFRQALEALAEE